MTPAQAVRLRYLASALSLLLLIAAGAVGWFYFQLRASLPLLDGTHALPGLSAPVTATRDALGVPTVRGATRADVARALGFLHAQERFFQMDLLRRRAAGELAALIGAAALPLDRHTRPHRFRELARKVLATLPADDRALLESYTAGANAGLTALGQRPFEYLVLRAAPDPWLAEDSVLISYAMTLDLQDDENVYERTLMALRDQLGLEGVDFFSPLLAPGDAAIDGSTAPLPPPPKPSIINLRLQDAAGTTAAAAATTPSSPLAAAPRRDPELNPGSNSFAVSGAHTTHGGALLANDPHLGLGVPNLWYRALLEWPGAAGEPAHRVVGVTLPGLPFVVLGSNGRIAWGLTVAYADVSDFITLEVNPIAKDLYKVPGSDDLLQIETHTDTIAVKGGEPVTVETRWSHWGPILGHDATGEPLVHRWVAYDPAATNLNFGKMETATSTADAVAIAHNAGMPAHNLLVADATGNIAWTVIGKFPRRVGFSGRLPVSWTYGDRRWEGFVGPGEVPTVANPPSGKLWTANNRIVGGDALALIGDGGYALPPRAAQIRDRLLPLAKVTPADLLGIALDDRAVFHEPWRQRLLAVLTPAAVAGHEERAELRRLVENWEGRASVDSVSYRLVRAFRRIVADRALTPVFRRSVEAEPKFDWRRLNYEPALVALLDQKPLHLLAPEYASWDDLLLAAADQVVRDVGKEAGSLARATWGQRNTARIQHPFSLILPPLLARWLDMPADPLPGDTNMPRMQTPDYGASMRLVVAPGHEDEGLFQMPGGQSGHPLSPFYRAGHAAWVQGEPSPLLPGATLHTLQLQP